MNNSQAITIGFISMIVSQFILSFSSSLYSPSNNEYNNFIFNLQNMTFALGMFFLALGTSFANLSITHIINTINDDDSRVQAFSIYYPIVNFGVIIGIIIMSVIIGENNYPLYKWSFLLFGIISMAGLIVFHMLKNKYLVDNHGKLMKDEHSSNSIKDESNKHLHKLSSQSITKIKDLNLKERILLFKRSLSQKEKDRLTVFIIFLIIITIYRIGYSQTSIAMIFFIDFHVERDLYFFKVPVQLFCILNPIFILILSPIFIKFNNKINEREIELGSIKKTIVAMIFITLCFTLMSVIGYYIDINAVDKISIFWILLFEMLLAISELFSSIAGYSLVADLSPEKYYSLYFGFYLATRSIAMFLSGIISAFFPDKMDAGLILNNIVMINGLMDYFLICNI
ncbi:MAG: peptide MFS transporter [Methanobrevibacter sp.]|nr:peptide MFS transporter [Methanobrevibacter sp.]